VDHCADGEEPIMTWGTNTEHQTVVPQLPQACKDTYNAWAANINNRHQDPRNAAKSLGKEVMYEVLKTSGKNKYCSIRLSKEHRVYFIQNDDNQVCDIRKVGSHQKPSGF